MNTWTTFVEFIESYPIWARLLAFGGIAVTTLTFILVPRTKPLEQVIKVNIIKPENGAGVPWGFPVTGTFGNLPKDVDLWIFTTEDSRKRYWPQSRIITADSTWEGRVNGLGGEVGKIRTFGVFMVGKDGQALLDLFKRAIVNHKGMDLTELTSDIKLLKEVSAVLKSEKPGTVSGTSPE